MTEQLLIGLMSGTSADGIDAALVRFSDGGHVALVEEICHPWPHAIQQQLLALGQGGELTSLEALGTLDVQVAEHFAEAAKSLLASSGTNASQVRAIGSHGQTIRHRPHGAHHDDQFPFTMQIGDPNVIAERTGITTVADFRRRDVAAGGQGAPLVPAFHQALFALSTEDRAILNLGGIGNFTLLPAHGEVRGFDTGPANALMDAWCNLHTGERFDMDGAYAATGTVDANLLLGLMSDPYFAKLPPKSTGREHFHLRWLHEHLLDSMKPVDVQATLIEVTVQSIAQALIAAQPNTQRLLVCGGGVHNVLLMHRLQQLLSTMIIESTSDHGVAADAVEAMAFAWLAKQTLDGLPGNAPSVTGARGPRVLGAIYIGGS